MAEFRITLTRKDYDQTEKYRLEAKSLENAVFKAAANLNPATRADGWEITGVEAVESDGN